MRLSDGRVMLAVGPTLSYCEFRHPMSDRLTDEAWRALLPGADAPAPPPWTEGYRVPLGSPGPAHET